MQIIFDVKFFLLIGFIRIHWENSWSFNIDSGTECLKSLDPICIVTCWIKWANTSWANSIIWLPVLSGSIGELADQATPNTDTDGPRILDPICTVTSYIKWVKTSGANSIIRISDIRFLLTKYAPLCIGLSGWWAWCSHSSAWRNMCRTSAAWRRSTQGRNYLSQLRFVIFSSTRSRKFTKRKENI